MEKQKRDPKSMELADKIIKQYLKACHSAFEFFQQQWAAIQERSMCGKDIFIM